MATFSSPYLEIIERDSAGAITSSYVASTTPNSQAPDITSTTKNPATRVDKVPLKETKSYVQQILDVFLPAGYPHSVTDDYIQCVHASARKIGADKVSSATADIRYM